MPHIDLTFEFINSLETRIVMPEFFTNFINVNCINLAAHHWYSLSSNYDRIVYSRDCHNFLN